MKVKNIHCSKFSNLSNWKEEAWKKQIRASMGFEHVTSAILVPCCDFFVRLLLSNCLNWKIYCDDHSSLSSTTAVQIWIISYKLHIFKTICAIHTISYSWPFAIHYLGFPDTWVIPDFSVHPIYLPEAPFWAGSLFCNVNGWPELPHQLRWENGKSSIIFKATFNVNDLWCLSSIMLD